MAGTFIAINAWRMIKSGVWVFLMNKADLTKASAQVFQNTLKVRKFMFFLSDYWSTKSSWAESRLNYQLLIINRCRQMYADHGGLRRPLPKWADYISGCKITTVLEVDLTTSIVGSFDFPWHQLKFKLFVCASFFNST